jgi:SsrA-binding protein
MAGKNKNKNKNKGPASRVAADNRKARHLYFIEDEHEAGIALQGTEVKSLRDGKANIQEAYAEEKNGELWLINAHIPEFSHGNRFNHEPRRPRKLLMKRKEINRLGGAVQKDGMTLVPLKIIFNDRGRAKLMLGLGKGKKLHDKRETEKQRDWQRQKSRLMKDYS